MSCRSTLVRLGVGSLLAGGLALTGTGVALADTPASGTPSAAVALANTAPSGVSSAVPMRHHPKDQVRHHPKDQAEYRKGFREGYRQGYQDGRKDCKTKKGHYYYRSVPNAYTQGYTAGYDAGYDRACRKK